MASHCCVVFHTTFYFFIPLGMGVASNQGYDKDLNASSLGDQCENFSGGIPRMDFWVLG